MTNETYFNVPSMIPLTKTEAYKIAKDRWSVHAESNRQGHAGITWQGIRGATHYAEWAELPAPTRQYL